jgi:hypothetical protein
MMNIGLRILPIIKRPDAGLVQQYGDVVTPHISDNMNRMHAIAAGGDLTNAIAGEINVPVSIGGMVVHPGDIVVGDEDGTINRDWIDQTLRQKGCEFL